MKVPEEFHFWYHCGSILLIVTVLAISFWTCKESPTESNRTGALGANPILFNVESVHVTNKELISTYQLWSMNEDGTDAHELYIPGTQNVQEASWSPFGGSIAFIDGKDGGSDAIASLKVIDQSGTITQIAQQRYGADPMYADRNIVWLPDGQRLIVAAYSQGSYLGATELFLVSLPTKTIWSIYQADRLVRPYSASPDGNTLYAFRNQPLELARITLTGETDHVYDVVGWRGDTPLISHDGSTIIYAGMTEPNPGETFPEGLRTYLYTMNQNGNNIRRHTISSYSSIIPVAWSADDKRVLVNLEFLDTTLGYYVFHLGIVDIATDSLTDITPKQIRAGTTIHAFSWRE